MRAGKLRDVVTLRQPAAGQDEVGQPTVGFVDVDTVFADVRVQGGVETIRADKVGGVVRASVRIRARSDVQVDWRVVWGSVVLDVEAVLPTPTGADYTDLVCEVVQ